MPIKFAQNMIQCAKLEVNGNTLEIVYGEDKKRPFYQCPLLTISIVDFVNPNILGIVGPAKYTIQ